MKKMTRIVLLALVLVLCASMALAETLPTVMHRQIAVRLSTGNNQPIEGESPTTGLPTTKTTYAPILVQIDNNKAAYPQWGISKADVLYEMPISGQGFTRMTALFNDEYPEEAGPVRSGRVLHADLREEWDAVFAFYGKQEAGGSDLRVALKEYGVGAKGLAIDGIGNKYTPAYFQRVSKKAFDRTFYHKAPHNVTLLVNKLMQEQIAPMNYPFPVRPYLFTDEKPTIGTQAHRVNIMHKNNPDTASVFSYNEATNAYQRYVDKGPFVDLLYQPDQPIEYANVIVMRTRLTFNGHSANPLLPDVVGSGAAEIFTGGRYIPGAWVRQSIKDRTVFYDSEGNELKFQRGKTFITIGIEKTTVSIDGDTGDLQAFFREAQEYIKKNPLEKEDVDRQAETVSAQPAVQAVDLVSGPKMNVDFQFAKAKVKNVVQYYTPVRLEGFEPTVYMFVDKEGVSQFRVYGKIPGRDVGFYPVSVTRNAEPEPVAEATEAPADSGLTMLGGGTQPQAADQGAYKPYEVQIVSDRPVRDAKVFRVTKAMDMDPAQVPQGLIKEKAVGVYAFTNIFGKMETLVYASPDGVNYAFYLPNVRRPLAGSPEMDMDDVMKRMMGADGATYVMPDAMKGGYAKGVKVKLTDGQTVLLMTDFPQIDVSALQKK